MADTASDDLLLRLGRLETGQLSDVLDEAGLPNQVLASTIRPLAPGDRVVGRAACLAGETTLSAGHGPAPLPADALERAVAPGTILVIATGGFVTGACIGGFVAYSLQRDGCRGLVTDGAVRDADEIQGLGFPVFSAAVTPINGSRRWRLTQSDVAVRLPGQTGLPVAIAPGDLILADGDGVVVVPAGAAEQVIADAEELQRIEARIGEALRAGGRRAEVFRANPRFAHVRPARTW